VKVSLEIRAEAIAELMRVDPEDETVAPAGHRVAWHATPAPCVC
jgi:hypothetical protein